MSSQCTPAGRPSRDFDHNSEAYARTWVELNASLRRECPVTWTDQHGGFWVLSRYADVSSAARDPKVFSSARDLDDPNGPKGVLIPPTPVLALPIEVDPPLHNEYRRVLAPYFAPSAVERWERRIRTFTTERINDVIETGAVDFILDIANPVPAMFTLELVGLPVEEWERFARPLHDNLSYGPGTPENTRAVEGMIAMVGELHALATARRQHPSDDVMTALVQGSVEGRPLTDEEAASIALLVLAGGVDTTTALLGQALMHLHRNPDHRDRLLDNLDDASLVDSATEEFLRFYTPVQVTARNVVHDTNLGGECLRLGERVLLSWASANHDEIQFPHADTFVIDRVPNRHSAFGLGPHRCIGSNFARGEFKVMLTEILRRMPDFEILDDAVEPYDRIANANGFRSMPARFTPGHHEPLEMSSAERN